jgi:hypothetical protein
MVNTNTKILTVSERCKVRITNHSIAELLSNTDHGVSIDFVDRC